MGHFFQRMRIVLILACIGLGWYGYNEYKVSEGTGDKPADVELADLEADKPLPQNYVKVGDHMAMYHSLIYSFDQKHEKDPNHPVDYSFYPIISKHAFKAWVAAQPKDDEQHRAAEEVPLGKFKVLVKTDRFKTKTMLPEDLKPESGLTGLVINKISSLKSDEVKLIKQQYPNVNFDQVLILEDGRKPSSAFFSIAMMALAGGGFLVLIGSFFVISRRR